MSGSDTDFDPPRWVGVVVLGSTVLALLTYVLDGPVPTQVGRGFAALAGSGFVYLLYLWGQHRDPPSGGSGSDGRRERELEAEAGGYGGSGGGN